MLRLLLWLGGAAALSLSTAAPSLSPRSVVSRRGAAAAVAAAVVLPAAAADDRAPAGPMTKLASGVRFVDVTVGDGAAARAGSKVSLQWVLRRSNGYLVTSSFGQLASGPDRGVLPVGDDRDRGPFIFEVGGGAAVPGLDEGVRGMRRGGVRRIVVPAARAYTLPVAASPGPVPNDFGPRRQIDAEVRRGDPDNYFLFEVEALNVREGGP